MTHNERSIHTSDYSSAKRKKAEEGIKEGDGGEEKGTVNRLVTQHVTVWHEEHQ